MRESEVPQDAGLFEGMRGLTYAVGRDGRYVQVPTEGWEPVNYANGLARERLDLNLRVLRERVRTGLLSPLAYHMARAKMDEWLLAKYAGIPRRRLRRHLTPEGFAALTDQQMRAYAEVFGVSVEAMRMLPSEESA